VRRNQVEHTVSCEIALDGSWQGRGVSRATVTLRSGACHAGRRWPHQSWREMHQCECAHPTVLGLRYCSGVKAEVAFVTAAMAFPPAGDLMNN